MPKLSDRGLLHNAQSYSSRICYNSIYTRVAQLDRALVSGTKGRGFESLRAYQMGLDRPEFALNRGRRGLFGCSNSLDSSNSVPAEISNTPGRASVSTEIQ